MDGAQPQAQAHPQREPQQGRADHDPARWEEKRRIVVALHSPLPSSSSAGASSSSAPAPHNAAGPSGAGATAGGGSPKSLASGTATRNPFFVDDPFEHLPQPPVSAPAAYSGSSSGFSRVRKDRATRRSADVLLHVRAIDDEHRAQRQQGLLGPGAIRETSRADIVTDEIGALAGVNEYAVIKELGRGAFAEVKLCRKQPASSFSPSASMSPEPPPFASSGASGGSGASSPVPLSSSPTLGAGAGPISRGASSSGSIREGEELYAIKVFSKSLLLRCKNFQRGQQGRLAVTTGLDKVQREVAIMKKLVHPHLVKLFEVIDDASKDALYLVLEYVPGGAIMEYSAEERRYFYPRSRDGTMGEAKAAQVLCDVLAGLVYLHMHHICHRDLKPENVLVDRHGRCKIADFGVAHYFEEEEAKAPPSELRELYRSHSRGLLSKSDGTWCFWAPEMCRAGTFSGYSCDIWAAGVCLWAFVFGSLPFQLEDSPDELFEAICEREPVFPDAKEASPELQDLLQQFLRKPPADRITLGDALDHPWSQLADDEPKSPGRGAGGDGEDEEAEDEAVPPSPGLRGTLRSRAYSFQRVHVTADEVQGAIRSVNNFVLVSKLRKKLTQKLREARASLVRVSSPFTSPAASPANSPPESPSGSRGSSPTPPPGPHHHHSASSPTLMGGADGPDAVATSQGKGRRSTSFTASPIAFLPPALFGHAASSPGALGASGTSATSATGSGKKPHHHKKKSGGSVSLDDSSSSSWSAALGGLLRSPMAVREQFGMATPEEEGVEAAAAVAGADAGAAEPEATGAAVGESIAPLVSAASPLPPVDEQEPQRLSPPPSPPPASHPLGKPPRSPQSLLQRGASPPLAFPGRHKTAKLRSTDPERAKRESCSLM